MSAINEKDRFYIEQRLSEGEAPSRYFQNPKLYGYYLILGTKHLCGDIIPTLKSLA
ncbi:hypothetical protein [Piscirickettsia salmonis]|uniref:hypothetical protein n=1 Tax=Piscirickettsia salmonis TaxID=1238 RepID=UPI0012BAF8B2|nr:hypothetical protein [Piscirickettsia salmonis]